ncbi:MAG: GGDEF domain-containing protein [Gammaproteobacteria bacterium]|jgi:diguanylate cyclase (GGDEF)-like protein|nr:GGDEF domain-containing protein [Gammaproteobacteria bacterium]
MTDDIAQSELKGFSRTLAELEWLLLVLVLLYFVLPSTVIIDPWSMLVAMAIYAAFVISFRYSKLFTRETQWKLAVETWAIIFFISWCVYQTGGIDSPLINLYLLVIIFSALTLGKLVTLLEFILISAAYFYLAQSSVDEGNYSILDFSEMIMTFVPYLLVAYLTSLLAADLKNAREGLEQLSDTDELTGLKNRRAFNSALQAEAKKAARYNRVFSVLMLDADNLKPVNDRFGHAAGDKLLVSIAQVVQESLRETDILARYGGDEFVVMLTETTEDRAFEVAERIRAAVENTSFSSSGERVSSTVSIGISSVADNPEEWGDIIARADSKLYESKRKGKNSIS